MQTDFARKILALGTNQAKMAVGRSAANHGNKGWPFRLALPRADYCHNFAEIILILTTVKRAELPKLYSCFCRPPFLIPSRLSLLGYHTDRNFRLLGSSSLHVNSSPEWAPQGLLSPAVHSLALTGVCKNRTWLLDVEEYNKKTYCLSWFDRCFFF